MDAVRCYEWLDGWIENVEWSGGGGVRLVLLLDDCCVQFSPSSYSSTQHRCHRRRRQQAGGECVCVCAQTTTPRGRSSAASLSLSTSPPKIQSVEHTAGRSIKFPHIDSCVCDTRTNNQYILDYVYLCMLKA
jgi:hypothetical protein